MSALGSSPVFSQELADFSFLRPLKPTLLFTAFWRFAAERQRVFWRRAAGLPPPWTTDPVLTAYKFTNAYRASDRVSQYLIRSVIYEGALEPREVFFRTLLFKLFNRIETWQLLQREAGPLQTDCFCVDRYDRVLSAAMAKGMSIYSAAYIMPSGGKGAPCARKHRMHLEMLARMLRDELPEHMADMATMTQAFAALRAYPTTGDFLAYQYATDLNYGALTDFSETEFVVPGPGALSGLRKCFADTGRLTDAEVVRLVQERQAECFATAGVTFPSLPDRALQMIDVQNLFCEIDKYARVAYPQFAGLDGRQRIKQRFQPSAAMLPLWYPRKWNQWQAGWSAQREHRLNPAACWSKIYGFRNRLMGRSKTPGLSVPLGKEIVAVFATLIRRADAPLRRECTVLAFAYLAAALRKRMAWLQATLSALHALSVGFRAKGGKAFLSARGLLFSRASPCKPIAHFHRSRW